MDQAWQDQAMADIQELRQRMLIEQQDTHKGRMDAIEETTMNSADERIMIMLLDVRQDLLDKAIRMRQDNPFRTVAPEDDNAIKAIAYDEENGGFIAIRTIEDLHNIHKAGYPIVIYSVTDGYQFYNYKSDEFEDIT